MWGFSGFRCGVQALNMSSQLTDAHAGCRLFMHSQMSGATFSKWGREKGNDSYSSI